MQIIGDRDGAGRLGSGASLLADIVFAGGCRDQLPRVIAKAPIVGNRAVIVVFAVIVGEDEVEQCRLLDDAVADVEYVDTGLGLRSQRPRRRRGCWQP